MIYLSDAVYYLMLNYYWFNISEKEQSYGNACEQKALDRADAVIHSHCNYMLPNDYEKLYANYKKKAALIAG